METVIVAAGLVFKNGKILITQRKREAHLGNFWEFPGGKKKEDEDLSSCLARELREELGIQVRVGAEFLAAYYEYIDRKVDLHFFHCEWESGDILSGGCQQYLWIEKELLDSFSFPPANFELIQKLKSSVSFPSLQQGGC